MKRALLFVSLTVAACSSSESSSTDAAADSTSTEVAVDTSVADTTDALSDASDATDTSDTSDAGCAAPSTALQWIKIPAGSFSMGCTSGDTTCAAGESPAHTVTVATFQLLQTEVTRLQYDSKSSARPSKYAAEDFASCGDDCPIDNVSFIEAKAWCEALGARLPTEAEMEWAIRAGSSKIYPCGDDVSCVDAYAWHAGNSVDDAGLPGLKPVGKKLPNAYCLYDLQGNALEWTADYWHDTYAGAPTDGSAWVDPTASFRVQRGSAYKMTAGTLRSSARAGDNEGIYFNAHPGFRCAR